MNQTGNIWKFLRSHNGGEFSSKYFDSYCSYNGIRKKKTVLGTPQENGVSERMNMIIMECARCMRLYVGLPLQFWDNVVVYLINGRPSSILDGGILEEAWISKRVNYSFLRTFGGEALSILIKKIEQSMRLNPRNAYLLDMGLMILVIAYGVMKITKSLGVEM